MIRWALLALLWAAPALAWVKGGDVPASNWVALVEGIRERREATWYGPPQIVTNWWNGVQTNLLYFAQPRDYVQPIKISLGTVTTSYWPESWEFLEDPVGPVITETNVSGGVTNIWTWTNHVALDTDYLWPSGGVWLGYYYDPFMPYGPQVATNLLWTNADARLAPFTNLLTCFTAAPSRAVVAALDADLIEVIPRYVDIRQMETVTGLAATNDEQALISAYMATPISTNWYWVDTDITNVQAFLDGLYDQSGTDFTGDTWMSEAVYPTNLPPLTVSNAWKWAGIEPYGYPASIETGSLIRFGWEDGSNNFYGVTNSYIRTNWIREYSFTKAPTLTPWRLPLGQLRVSVTNALTSTTTNEEGVVTTIVTNQLWPVLTRADWGRYYEWFAASYHSPRLLGLESAPTNWVQLTPPGTGTVWQSLIGQTNWTLAIHGRAARTDTNGLFEPSVAWSNTVDYTSLVWAPTDTLARVALDMTGTYYRLVDGLSVSNWPIREEVWSNGVLQATASVVGVTIDLWIEGSSYEHIGISGDSPTIWTLGTNDWSERARVVRQLRWMAGHPVASTNWWDGYNEEAYGEGTAWWLDEVNYTAYFSTNCGLSNYSTNDPCSNFPDFETFLGVIFSGHEPRGAGGDWHVEWRFGFVYSGYDSLSMSSSDWAGNNFWNTYDDAYLLYRVKWPEEVTVFGQNLSSNLACEVDFLARVAYDETRFLPPPVLYVGTEWNFYSTNVPAWPLTQSHTMWSNRFYLAEDGCSWTQDYQVVTNEVVYGSDLLGVNQLSNRLWATTAKATGATVYAFAPVDFSGGVRPTSTWYTVSTLGWSDSVTVPCESDLYSRGSYSESQSETRLIPRTTERELKNETHVIRWRFRNLAE